MDVVVGYDGSDASKRALAFAATLAADGRLTVVNVAPALRFGFPDPLFAQEQEALLEEARRLLDERARTETVSAVGDAAHELVEAAAAAGAQLLAVGTHVRGAVGRFVLGSVSLAVAHEAPCSVLLVP